MILSRQTRGGEGSFSTALKVDATSNIDSRGQAAASLRGWVRRFTLTLIQWSRELAARFICCGHAKTL